MINNENVENNNIDEKLLPSVEDNVTSKPNKKSGKNKLIALILSAAIVTSSLFGFAGGYVFDKLQANASPSSKEVLYQSVIRTVSTNDNSSDSNSPMTVSEVAETVKESVVEITTETTTNSRMGQQIATGAGSGVIISSDGYIVTNNHVISDAENIKVRLSDGSEYDAKLIGTDSKTDLAVLKINKTGLMPAVLGDSSTLANGESIVAVGNPLGELGGTVTQGIISALDREITIDGETMSLLQTDAAINPGNSGGGLFNLYGELIGIVNAKSSGLEIEGLGFAIPINTAKEVIEDLISNGYVQGRVDTGLTVLDISDAQTAMMYHVNQVGLYITNSTNSELQSGDKITAINGTTITDLASYNAVIDSLEIGDKIDVTVIRNNKSVTVTITLTEQKS